MIPLRDFSVLRGKKFLTENCDTPSITPLIIHKIHRNLKLWEEQEGSSTKVFGIFRQKTFDGKFWYSPFLFINLLANDTFPIHSTGLSAYDVIRYCKTKNFWQKIVILSSSQPSSPKISSISEFFWNTEGFPYEIFRHCGPTIFL